jgi:hypothetical protein
MKTIALASIEAEIFFGLPRSLRRGNPKKIEVKSGIKLLIKKRKDCFVPLNDVLLRTINFQIDSFSNFQINL